MTVVIENEAIAIKLLHDRDFLLVGWRIECPAGKGVVILSIVTRGICAGAAIDAYGPSSAAICGLVARNDYPRNRCAVGVGVDTCDPAQASADRVSRVAAVKTNRFIVPLQ